MNYSDSIFRQPGNPYVNTVLVVILVYHKTKYLPFDWLLLINLRKYVLTVETAVYILDAFAIKDQTNVMLIKKVN